MRVPRVHSAQPLATGARIQLEPGAAHHLLRVLRLPAGALLRVFDGAGAEFEARTLGDGLPLSIELLGPIETVTESPLRITLAQAVAKGERMDYALQKCVELGVDAIQPLFTRRSVVRLEGARLRKREAHWDGVVLAACEQSGRVRRPRLQPTLALADWLRGGPVEAGGGAWLLDPRAPLSLAAVELERPRALLLIGPEGGLSETEIEAAHAAGFGGVRLGPRILRTETAAVVALSVLQAKFGDLA